MPARIDSTQLPYDRRLAILRQRRSLSGPERQAMIERATRRAAAAAQAAEVKRQTTLSTTASVPVAAS